MNVLDSLIHRNIGSMYTVAVIGAHDEEVLQFVMEATKKKLSQFLLFGKEEWIRHFFVQHHFISNSVRIIDCQSKEEELNEGMMAIVNNHAQLLMKGNISTASLLKVVLKKEYGLRQRETLSHVALFQFPHRENPIFLTDAAMNIAPNVEQKAHIIQNTVDVARAIGIEKPKVALLAAVEVVNEKMPATIDAKQLEEKNKHGEIQNCIVCGPIALDGAVSIFAAQQKGIMNDVAGMADVLVAPSIEVGNALYKSFIYFGLGQVGAIISGAKIPIVLTSRSDSAQSKLYSLALAIEVAKNGGNK